MEIGENPKTHRAAASQTPGGAKALARSLAGVNGIVWVQVQHAAFKVWDSVAWTVAKTMCGPWAWGIWGHSAVGIR